MKLARLLLALLAVALLLALPGAALAQIANITGTINLQPYTTLPSNALVTVQLADVTHVPATLIAQQQFTTNGAQAPLSFTLPYDQSKIASSEIYSVQGHISVTGQVHYSTNTQYRVLTGGYGTTVSITMVPVSLPNTSSGTWLLGVAALFLALVLVIGLLRPRLVVGHLA
jgi:putative lipoprotein